MKLTVQIILLVALALTVACGNPTIDASTDEAMKASSQKVRESLSESKRLEFDEAIQVLAFSQINMKDLFAEGAAGGGILESKIRESLDGKTGEEIIAEAKRVTADRKYRESQQALEEIKELEAKRLATLRAREELNKLQVLRSRFYMKEREFMGKQPIIELTVKNGTSSAISRAYFEGTIASPGRSVPWHRDTFNYSIAGGLEPEEKASWRLTPNMFSDWGKVDAPVDAIFKVTVQRIDGPDGESLFSVRDFGEREGKRLAELKQTYGVE